MIGYRVAKPVRRELDLELCPKPALGRNGFRRALRLYECHGFIKSFSYASLGRPGWEKRGIQASKRFCLRNGEWGQRTRARLRFLGDWGGYSPSPRVSLNASASLRLLFSPDACRRRVSARRRSLPDL